MVLEKILQSWMVVHIRAIVDQLRVFPQLLRDFRLGIEVVVGFSNLAAMDVRPTALEFPLTFHESVGMLLNVFANSGMVVKEIIQTEMVVHVRAIVDQF